jgi:hypothetical protein
MSKNEYRLFLDLAFGLCVRSTERSIEAVVAVVLRKERIEGDAM